MRELTGQQLPNGYVLFKKNRNQLFDLSLAGLIMKDTLLAVLSTFSFLLPGSKGLCGLRSEYFFRLPRRHAVISAAIRIGRAGGKSRYTGDQKNKCQFFHSRVN
ncbi:hypothetical protein [Parapedobacter lycopersici]|uniref:hypothetical protein n=1 Tax=Parapedobacter lycopersici TaxID=1864939 RepID=UPI00214DDF34|nr:hypothetical protein [Parapedobacter lycopersici]